MATAIIQLDQAGPEQSLTISPPKAGVPLQGRIRVPGDKSISHRALMLGAIATGTTHIEGLLLGDDPRSTAACLRAMGATIAELNADSITITGTGLALQEPSTVLDAGNSGTTMRLMLGLLASQPDRFFTVTGDASLRLRPMKRVIDPLRQMGASIWCRQGGFAPLAIQGRALSPIHYRSPVASAQVKSCILLAGLRVDGTTVITEPAQSRDHSERMLAAFGATVRSDPDARRIELDGPAQLTGQSIVVPGDISSAAFWLVAAAITPGADLTVENVGINPTRTGILDVLQRMNANIVLENERTVTGEPVADLHVTHSALTGCTIEGDLIPKLIDEIPILAVAAAFAQGTTTIRDAAELRVKESDRIAVMASELSRLGAAITERHDGLDIEGGHPLTGGTVDSYTDHRIAMSLAIAALNASSATTIHRAEAASISYPDFVPTLIEVCT